MKTNNYNLQILHHEEVFATRELALAYLNDFYKPNSLDAEPVIVKYGDTRSPDVILAFGTSDAAPGSFYAIDMTKANTEIADLTEQVETDKGELDGISESLGEIVKAAGFNVDENKIKDKITYQPDVTDNVIGTAISIAQAIDLLSKYTQEGFADGELSVEDTKSVRLIYSVNPDGGKILKAEVNVSSDGDTDELNFNNNIIGVKADGLYAASNLEYDDVRHELIFTTSGYKNGRFQDDAIVQRVNLGEHTKLVADNEGNNVKLIISEDPSTYTTTVSANVQISSNEDNILEVKDGKLMVSGRAKNIKYGETNVANVLTETTNRINELGTAVENAAKTAHIEGGQTDTMETVVDTLSDGGSRVTGNVRLGSTNSIVVRNGGLEANITVDVDAVANKLIVTVGNETITKTLPGIELFQSAEYNDENEELIITFKTGNTLVIPIHGIIHTWSVDNNANSPVVLTKTVVTGGVDLLSGDVRLRSIDNLIAKENGALYVSESRIDSKVSVETQRATIAEQGLQTSITNLSNSTTARFEEQSENISDVRDSVVQERERAVEVENAIREVSNSAKAIADEAKLMATEANSGVATLSQNLTETDTRLDELVERVNTNKIEANEKFAETNANVASNTASINDLTGALASEVTARTNADTEIDGKIELVKASVTDETNRAGAAETALGVRIDNLDAKVDHSVEDVEHLIADETARATAAEQANANRISEVEQAAGQGATDALNQAKAYTDTSVLAEKTEREAKDTELNGKITTLSTKVDNDIATAVRNASDDAAEKANSAKLEANNYTNSKVAQETARAAAAEQANADAISTITAELAEKIESVEVEKNNDLQYFIKVDGVKVGEINIPEDQFFKGATYNSTDKILTLTFNIMRDGAMVEESVNIDVKDLVDTYTAGDGLVVEANKFSVKKNNESESYLNVSNEGIGIFGVDAALAAKANVADFEVLSGKVDVINGNAALEGSFAKGDADTLAASKAYTNDKIATEANARETKDTELEALINTKFTEVSTAVATETTRATAAEQANADAIAVLNGNEAVEGSVKNAVKVSKDYTDIVKAQLEGEVLRATNAEQNLANTKANKTDVYTKEEADNLFLTEHQDISALATKAEVNAVAADLDADVAAINTELDKKIETVEIVKNSQSDLQYILKVDGQDVGEINIPKDQFLRSVTYNPVSKELTFEFETTSGTATTVVRVDDLVDTYTAGNGLTLAENQFSVRINEDSESYLTVSEEGIKLLGIDAALATKANVADVYTKAEIDAKGYITEHQSLAEYAKVADLESVDAKADANADAITLLNGNEAVEGSVKNAIAVSKAYTDEKVATKANSSDVYTKAEIDAKGYVSDISTLATKAELNAAIADTNAQFDAVDTELDKKIETVEIVKNSQSDLQYILKVDGQDAGEISIPKDQFLKSVTYNPSNKELTFEFETTSGTSTTVIKIDDLVDTYTAGNGLTLTQNQFSVRINEDSESYLTVSEEGIKLLGIDAALATKANAADVYTKAEADAKFLTEHQSLAEYAKVFDVQALETEVDANTAAVATLTGNEAVEGSVKNAVKVSKDYTDTKIAQEKQEREAADTALQTALVAKANGADVYTKTEIDNKGYLTQHQDISNLATKAELTTTNANVAQNTSDIASLTSTVDDMKFVTEESNTVRMTMVKETGAETRTLSSDVKIKTLTGVENANIIKSDANGLYATVSFAYDKATNKITFNDGNGDKVFELNNFGILQDALYDTSTQSIVLIVKKDDETTERITIPVGDLVNTWTVVNEASSPIVLQKTVGQDGDELSANVSILNNSHNLLVNQNGSLFVDSDSNKHFALWGTDETTVQGVINILKERTDEIEQIKSDIADLQTDNQNIRVQVSTFQTDLNNQKERLTNAESSITDIYERLYDYSLEVERVKIQVNGFEDRIASMERRVTETETVVHDLRTQLGDISGDTTVADRLAAIENWIRNAIDFGQYNTNGGGN